MYLGSSRGAQGFPVGTQFARKELTPESVVPKMTDFPFNKYVVLWEPSSCFISSFGDQKMTRYDKISLVSICFNMFQYIIVFLAVFKISSVSMAGLFSNQFHGLTRRIALLHLDSGPWKSSEARRRWHLGVPAVPK